MDRVPFFDLKIMGKRVTGAHFSSKGGSSFSVSSALEVNI